MTIAVRAFSDTMASIPTANMMQYDSTDANIQRLQSAMYPPQEQPETPLQPPRPSTSNLTPSQTSESRKSRTRLTFNEKVILIRTVVEHRDEFQRGKMTGFWHTIREKLFEATGKVGRILT